MSEVTEKEYKAQQSQKSNLEGQRKSYDTTIATLNDEIAQLERVKARVQAINTDFHTEVSTLKTNLNQERVFKGTQKTLYIDKYGANLLSAAETHRDDEVNHVLDEIETLLAEKKEQLASTGTLLDQVKAKINSIATWLNTHFFNN